MIIITIISLFWVIRTWIIKLNRTDVGIKELKMYSNIVRNQFSRNYSINKFQTETKLSGSAHFIFRITWYRFERQNATNRQWKWAFRFFQWKAAWNKMLWYAQQNKQQKMKCFACKRHCTRNPTQSIILNADWVFHSPFRLLLEILFIIIMIIELCPFLISHLSSFVSGFWN